MKKDEGGYIVVETITAFILFVFLVMSILSLVNIVAVQARVHYALTQTANTLSMYAYTLHVTGAAPYMMRIEAVSEAITAEADGAKEEINAIIGNLDTVIGEMEGMTPTAVVSGDAPAILENIQQAVGGVQTNGEALANRGTAWAQSAVRDPSGAVAMMLTGGVSMAGKEALELLLRPLVSGYLANGNMSGDAYLRSMHVVNGMDGLVFSDFDLFNLNSSGLNDSVILDSRGNTYLVLRYEIDYTFGALPLPEGMRTLSIEQTVKTKAWLNGEGEGYKK